VTQTMTEPIKIQWTGDARTKLGTRYIESRLYSNEEGVAVNAERAMDTLTRQKTQVVIETEEEAKAFMRFIKRAVRDGDNGRTWTTAAHLRAFERVMGEFISGLKEREWMGYEPDEYPNGFNWTCPNCGKDHVSGDDSRLFCMNCDEMYESEEVKA